MTMAESRDVFFVQVFLFLLLAIIFIDITKHVYIIIAVGLLGNTTQYVLYRILQGIVGVDKAVYRYNMVEINLPNSKKASS